MALNWLNNISKMCITFQDRSNLADLIIVALVGKFILSFWQGHPLFLAATSVVFLNTGNNDYILLVIYD